MSRRIAAVITAIAMASCAQIHETVRLQAIPLEKPRTTRAVVAKGHQLRGKRVGSEVVVQVAKADYCAHRTEQKARGYKLIERKPVGNGLVMEWVTGAVMTGGGGFLIWQSTQAPTTDTSAEQALDQSGSLRAYGAAMGMIGTALLVAAVYQTRQVGREKLDMGVRTLKRDGLAKPCNLSRASTGTVRMTLDEGLQVTAPIDATGHARVKLPGNIGDRIKQHGGRATLEVLGDWRSQRRIDISRDGAMSVP